MTHGEFLDWLDELDRLNPEKPKLAVLIERLKGEAYNLNQDQVIADIQALLNQISTFDESIVYPRAHPVGRVLNTFIRGSETALFLAREQRLQPFKECSMPCHQTALQSQYKSFIPV